MKLNIKHKLTKGSKFNQVKFTDDTGYVVHCIISAFDETMEKGFQGRWHYKDAYLRDNKLHVTKWDSKEERRVSYPIKKNNKYFIHHKAGKPQYTAEQLLVVIDRMANTIINTQEMFNKAQDQLEKLDGNSQLKILVQSKEDLIESYFHIFNRYNDEEIDD